jgi:hypothetical protein
MIRIYLLPKKAKDCSAKLVIDQLIAFRKLKQDTVNKLLKIESISGNNVALIGNLM